MNKIFLVAFSFLSIYSCSQNLQKIDLSTLNKFEERSLPIVLETEDYSVYNLFDNKEEWDDVNLITTKNGCRYKYGYKISKSNYFIIIYPRECNDSLTYWLTTINLKGEIVSTLEILGLYNDDQSTNGYLSDNLQIKLVHRTLLKNDNKEAKVKALESEENYRINNSGEILLVGKMEKMIRYYNLDSKGKFILIETNH